MMNEIGYDTTHKILIFFDGLETKFFIRNIYSWLTKGIEKRYEE